MDAKHRQHAIEMAAQLRRMMFDAHLMKYRMHSHFHPVVGSRLSNIADLAMRTAVALEEDLDNWEESSTIPGHWFKKDPEHAESAESSGDTCAVCDMTRRQHTRMAFPSHAFKVKG